MTDKLNEFLAVEVMGWESSGEMRLSYKTGDFDNNGLSMRQWKSDWNPAENIEQAMMCANVVSSTEEIVISICDGETWCKIGHGQTTVGYVDQEKSTALAISLACARAKGWKDE